MGSVQRRWTHSRLLTLGTLLNRPCLGPAQGVRCPYNAATPRTRCQPCQRQWDARRNASPKRKALYNSEWTVLRNSIVAEHPYCAQCGTALDLTVDHPTLMVLCRSHHSALEAQRRRGVA